MNRSVTIVIDYRRDYIKGIVIDNASEVNEGKSAASFCHQVAALVPDMFCNFYFVKNLKIANNSATTEAREIISTDLKSS